MKEGLSDEVKYMVFYKLVLFNVKYRNRENGVIRGL